VTSATTEALQRTTHQSHRLPSQLLRYQFTELSRHHLHRPLPDRDRLWTHLVHLRRLRHKEICLWTHMAETTTLIATMKPANRRHQSPVPSRFLLHQSLPEKPSTLRMIALMTCTLLPRQGSRWIVHRHRRRPSPSSKRQCLPCHLFRSQVFLHVRHRDNHSTYNGHSLPAGVQWNRAGPQVTMARLLPTSTSVRRRLGGPLRSHCLQSCKVVEVLISCLRARSLRHPSAADAQRSAKISTSSTSTIVRP
jgi:hypothetical protein